MLDLNPEDLFHPLTIFLLPNPVYYIDGSTLPLRYICSYNSTYLHTSFSPMQPEIYEGKKQAISRLDATLRNIIDTSPFKHLVVERYSHQQYQDEKGMLNMDRTGVELASHSFHVS